MASTQEGRNLIYHSWTEGESGWKNQMDSNLTRLAAFTGLSVIDRDLTAPPGGPADGDAYIPAATATGVWVGKEEFIAVWSSADSAWEFFDLSLSRARLLVYVEDENRLVVWNGTNFLQGVNFS